MPAAPLDLDTLLAQFPKVRPPLPDAYQRIYTQYYQANRGGCTPASALAQRVEGWLHRQVARDVRRRPPRGATLEIGAGTLNHLPYEPHSDPYDIVEPFTALYADSPWRPRVRHIWGDLRDVHVHARYARIISVATFEHLEALPLVLAQAAQHLEPYGVLRVAIPSEGTWLWRLGWQMTTGREFRRQYGLDYGVLMRHEHVNTAVEIAALLRYFYGTVRQRVCGLSPAHSLYQFYAASDPRLDRCGAYLAR